MARTKAEVVGFCLLLVVCVVVVVLIAVLTRQKKCPNGTFTHAAVATDSEKCSQIGRDILQSGGSAVDGAIAALLCISVMNPQSAGIGGGYIFTVMNSSGEVKIINARETVPRDFKPNLLNESCYENVTMRRGDMKTINNGEDDLPCPKTFDMMLGSQWIGVPGEIRGYQEAHRRYGKLPWAKLFQPTIKLAREGISIPLVQGCYISFLNDTQAAANTTQHLRELFLDKNENLLKTNDIVKFEKLADTLEVIANEGPDAFYAGSIAKDLIHDIEEAGGTLTLQDLEEFAVTVTDAWAVPLGEYQMYIPPPPSGGSILSLILNIMKGYHMNATEPKTLTYHRYVEAFKFANGLKKHIHYPKFSSEAWAKNFTTDSFADYIRSLIRDDKTHDPQYYNITPSVDSMGTTHVSVLAEDGSAVSVTSTINHIFGSMVFSPRTGIILNNQLSDFCERVNHISPGEQPPSSLAPTVLKSPTKMLVIGGSGSSRIMTGLSSAIMNYLWFGKSLKEAIAAPVVYVDSENAVNFERGFDKNVIKALKALGHPEGDEKYFFNVVNAVEMNGSCIIAVSDERKRGKAAGY